MGTEAPRWWRQVLDQLAAAAEAAAAAGQQQPSNLQDICDTFSELDDLPKLPTAIWKKVLALQVMGVGARLPNSKASVHKAQRHRVIADIGF